MKICVTGTRGFPMIEGGVEKHCEALYPLIDRKIQITVFRRKPYIDTKNKNASYPAIQFIDLPSTTVKGAEALLHTFLCALKIRKLQPDIVHIHNIGPAIFAPFIKKSGAKIVLTYHSPNYEHDKWNAAAKSLLKISERIALRHADRIIFVNRFQMEKFDATVQAKSCYIPNGITPPAFNRQTDRLQPFGLQSKRYILAVGRITPEKDFATLIRAFYQSAAWQSGFKLVIAGGVEFENAYKKELEALITDNAVIFTDYVYGETLAQLYTHAALFVLSSVNEGFPLVLLEAMSYQLPIIASDIPACALAPLKESACFPCGDAARLSEKINENITQLQPQTYDLSAFNWQEIAQRVTDLYAELTEKDAVI